MVYLHEMSLKQRDFREEWVEWSRSSKENRYFASRRGGRWIWMKKYQPLRGLQRKQLFSKENQISFRAKEVRDHKGIDFAND